MELKKLRRRVLMSSPHLEKPDGDFLTFKTDMAKPLKKCESDITLIQDLHGQSFPYPAGGGKNIFNCNDFVILYKNAVAADVETSDDGTGVTITRSDSTTSGNPYVYFDLFEITESHVGKKYYVSSVYTHNPPYIPAIAVVDSDGTNRNRKNYYYTILAEDVGRHLTVAFYGLSSAGSVVEYTNIQVEQGTAITAWSPYENICPITGWNGMHFHATGKNLFDKDHAVFVMGKYIDANGGVSSNSGYCYMEDYIEVEPSTTYAVQYDRKGKNTGFTVPLYDENKVFIERQSAISAASSTGFKTGSFTTTSTTKYIRFSVNDSAPSIDTIQIEKGTEISDFEPFGTLYDVEFPAIGKNKISIDNTVGTALSRGLTATKNNDGSITVKGTYTSSSNGFIGSADDAVTLPAGEYIISGSTTGWYDSYGVQLYINATYGYVRGNPVTITLTEETTIPLRIHIIASKAQGVALPDEGLTFYPMIRSASDPADYEPYNTVYGGTLDLLTGVLTVDKVCYVVTSVSNVSGSSSSNAYAFIVCGGTGMINKNKGISNLLGYCTQTVAYLGRNQFREVSFTSGDCIAFKVNGTPVGVETEERLASVNAELSALVQAGTPLTFVSTLATPRTFQLTPQQITAIKGMNNIWADTGTTRIAYWTH